MTTHTKQKQKIPSGVFSRTQNNPVGHENQRNRKNKIEIIFPKNPEIFSRKPNRHTFTNNKRKCHETALAATLRTTLSAPVIVWIWSARSTYSKAICNVSSDKILSLTWDITSQEKPPHKCPPITIVYRYVISSVRFRQPSISIQSNSSNIWLQGWFRMFAALPPANTNSFAL